MSECYVIGEAGSNHDGKFDQALELMEAAADAGCDAVKFQCLEPFQHDWWPSLAEYAEKLKIDLTATPFDVDAVRFLADVGVPLLKIASPEIVNLPLIRAAAETGIPLVLSTGTASMSDIQEAVWEASVEGDAQKVSLLQCTTRYPAPASQANLRAMAAMRERFSLPVGLSDHTEGIAVPIAAVALGAELIEKHFTLDKTLEGPDHHYALEPDQLKAMVKGIREVEQALGDGIKEPQEGEIVEARGRSLTWT